MSSLYAHMANQNHPEKSEWVPLIHDTSDDGRFVKKHMDEHVKACVKAAYEHALTSSPKKLTRKEFDTAHNFTMSGRNKWLNGGGLPDWREKKSKKWIKFLRTNSEDLLLVHGHGARGAFLP